mmetsp:Transcript_129348/g.258250  ORF Transcript_129348/g.258250 Transcript_129348/m.258250 type:complete len:226 (+) Transcript_129348:60-737(+)
MAELSMMHLASSGGASEPTLSELVSTLKDGSKARSRWTAADALGQMGSNAGSAVPNLIAALEDRDQDVRISVARALGHIGEAAAPALPKLSAALSDRDSGMRWGAAQALGNLAKVAGPLAADLVKALADDEEDVRSAAATALGQMAQLGVSMPPTIGDDLTKLLLDEEWHVRRAAADALGRCGAAAFGALTALEKSRIDPHPRVARTAQAAVEKIREQAVALHLF